MAEKRIGLDEFKSDSLLEIKEVAEILDVTSKTVLRLINESKELPAIQVGRRWRVRPKDLEEYIQTHIRNPDTASTGSQKKEFINGENPNADQANLNLQVEELAQKRKAALIITPFDEAKLPMPPFFVGREADLRWLLDQLKADKVVNIAALRGLGGIGKTALAAKALHQL